jgi:DNA-binding MarR family transcriptional regulator
MNRLRLECHSVFMELYMKIKKIRKEHFNRLGIVPSHFHILKFIKPGDSLTVSEISVGVGKECSNIITIIDFFEARGFLQRKRDADDRRIVRVSLTPEGESYREDIIKKQEELSVGIYKDLSDEEVNKFLDVVRLVNSRISMDNV